MLTEQERATIKQKIDDLNTQINQQYDIRKDISNALEKTMMSWLTLKFAKISPTFKLSSFNISHPYGDWDDANQKYMYLNRLAFEIICVDGAYSPIDIIIEDGTVNFSTPSFGVDLDKGDQVDALRLKMFNRLVEAHDKLLEMTADVLDTDKQHHTKIRELQAGRNQYQTVLDNDDYKKKQETAKEQLSVGAVFKDGAGDGWYLEVKKITDKLVICNTACEWTWHSERKQNVAWRKGSRQIKKEDFISKIMSGFYSMPSDVEIKGE